MQQKIDECFAEKEIPADDSVRLLDKIVEEMDLRALMRAYDSHGRPPATPPRTMLKIVLYAAMEHNYSSRKIRSSCERDNPQRLPLWKHQYGRRNFGWSEGYNRGGEVRRWWAYGDRPNR